MHVCLTIMLPGAGRQADLAAASEHMPETPTKLHSLTDLTNLQPFMRCLCVVSIM